jgi:predicted DCC family thiol-disulfide oxidoreductase YuxK
VGSAAVPGDMENCPFILIYDGTCPLCLHAVAWLSARLEPDRIRFVPCDSEERRQRAPSISEAVCLEAVHLVKPDGTVLRGAEALPALLRNLRRWRYLAPFFAVPGVLWLAERLYRIIARRRHALSAFFIRKPHCGIGNPD